MHKSRGRTGSGFHALLRIKKILGRKLWGFNQGCLDGLFSPIVFPMAWGPWTLPCSGVAGGLRLSILRLTYHHIMG
jgi:hypothetical protein